MAVSNISCLRLGFLWLRLRAVKPVPERIAVPISVRRPSALTQTNDGAQRVVVCHPRCPPPYSPHLLALPNPKNKHSAHRKRPPPPYRQLGFLWLGPCFLSQVEKGRTWRRVYGQSCHSQSHFSPWPRGDESILSGDGTKGNQPLVSHWIYVRPKGSEK